MFILCVVSSAVFLLVIKKASWPGGPPQLSTADGGTGGGKADAKAVCRPASTSPKDVRELVFTSSPPPLKRAGARAGALGRISY